MALLTPAAPTIISPFKSDLIKSDFKPGYVVGYTVLRMEKKFFTLIIPSEDYRQTDLDRIGTRRQYPTRTLREYHPMFGGDFYEFMFGKISVFNADHPQPFRLLDIGVGKTTWTPFIVKGEFDRRALDLRTSSLTLEAITEDMVKYTVFSPVGDLHRYHPAESFDFITSNYGLHYQEYTGLEVILYLLKIGGEAMVTTINTNLAISANGNQKIYQVLDQGLKMNEKEITGYYHIRKIGPFKDESRGVDPNFSITPPIAQDWKRIAYKCMDAILKNND